MMIGSALDPAGWQHSLSQWLQMPSEQAITAATRTVTALLLFFAGWVVAKLLAYALYKLLCRADLDQKVARRLGVDKLVAGKGEHAIERGVARVAYWIAMLLVIVAVLQHAGLTQVAGPIQGLVDTVVQALPQIAKAALILVVGYFVASLFRLVVRTALDRVGVDQRVAELTDSDDEAPVRPFSATAGHAAFWLTMVVALAGAFDALQVGPIADPLRAAITKAVGFVPHLAVAVVIAVAGWLLGRVAQAITAKMLHSAGFDALLARFGFDRLTGKRAPSDAVSWVVFAFIVLQVGVVALDELGLRSLSDPLTAMVGQFWNVLPTLLVSILIVVLGVVLARVARTVVTEGLANVGFDRMMRRLGFGELPAQNAAPPMPGENAPAAARRDYSDVGGIAMQSAIVLLAVAQALSNLGLDTWSAHVNAFLTYCVKHVAVALVIVGVGIALGHYVRDLIMARVSEGAPAPHWLGEFGRYSVLVFAFTMAVHQLDVADDFVLMSFGLLFGSLCLALALAFGLGAREVAGDLVKRRYADAIRPTVPTPTVPSKPDSSA